MIIKLIGTFFASLSLLLASFPYNVKYKISNNYGC